MNADTPGAQQNNGTTLAAVVVVSLTVVGYFTGLQSPTKTASSDSILLVDEDAGDKFESTPLGVVPATHYANMSKVSLARRDSAKAQNLWMKAQKEQPLSEIKITEQEKLAALQRRDETRAFNGAPPTIPHPIEQRSDASCAVCHGPGLKTASLRIPRMSHKFLANCLQCHVEKNPRHATAVVFRENSFDGLKAPKQGPRAFSLAPPQVPHSTWMRSDCMSCHGYTGLHGIRTTHPWRTNCQQCHAPSAAMDQTLLAVEPRFLPAPKIKE